MKANAVQTKLQRFTSPLIVIFLIFWSCIFIIAFKIWAFSIGMAP